jgi:formamidopyrimidine-DNA glycosylase
MPELPEVEHFRQEFESYTFGHKILDVKVTDPGILGDISPHKLNSQLKGHQFTHTHRHGKFLFGEFIPGRWVVFHFGMTGSFREFAKLIPPEPHDRVLFALDNQRILAFNDQRKFGFIDIVDNIDQFIVHRKFGPDALTVNFSEFDSRLNRRTKAIKTILLDQSVIAGVGNLYADEALFQAQIHPLTLGSNLNQDQRRKLLDQIHQILQTAIKFGANYGKFPSNFFIHQRESNGICPRCASLLISRKIGGRTTYFCEKCTPSPTF